VITSLERADAEETFGGKAASLARAIGAGLPVPDGFAISWEAVAHAANGDAEARRDIVAAYHAHDGGRVAVRSSAVGEDSAGASFAGQHETILNVMSEDAVLEAVLAIHASARAEGVLEYRRRMGIDGAPRIAVVVQRMIEADCAGVMFTCDPVSGVAERVIESAWGLGEAVVAGVVTPDRFRVSELGKIIERHAATKELAIRFADGGGTHEIALTSEQASRLSLTDEQVVALNRLAHRCEIFFKAPQDVEWAFAGDTLHLLQSRPITRIAEEVSEPITPRRFTGLALAALLAPLNSTIIAVALPSIAGAFDSTAAMATRWLVTAYLVVGIVAQSPAGKLADLWGSSRVLTLGRSLFGIGALLAAFSPSLAILGVSRVLMALGGAFSIPTVFAQLRRSVPHAKRGRVFGVFGAVMGAAAAAGPILGAYLTTRFGWHSVFVVNVPVVLLSFILEPPSRRTEQATARASTFDFTGSALLGLAVLLLVAAVQLLSLPLAAAAIAATAVFVVRELRATDPVLDVRLFGSASFAAGSAIVALQNLAMYSLLFLLPFFLAQSGGEPARTGRMLLLFTAGMVLASPMGGRLSDAVGARAVAFSGAMIATGGALFFVLRGDLSALIPSIVLMGVGIGISTSPSQAAALSAIPASQAGVASGALSTMRYTGGVIGSGLVALLAAGGFTHDARLFVFPAVLFASAIASLVLPGKR